MILQASQLRGWPKERAELYGKPHLGARYTGKRSYELLQDPLLRLRQARTELPPRGAPKLGA